MHIYDDPFNKDIHVYGLNYHLRGWFVYDENNLKSIVLLLDKKSKFMFVVCKFFFPL